MTYEYQCGNGDCGAVLERIQPRTSERAESVTCEYCGSVAQFKISAPAVLTQNMTNKPFDVAVGRDAEMRWKNIHERQDQRDKVRRDSNQVGIQATKFNEFKPIPVEQQKRRSDALKAVERDGYKPTE